MESTKELDAEFTEKVTINLLNSYFPLPLCRLIQPYTLQAPGTIRGPVTVIYAKARAEKPTLRDVTVDSADGILDAIKREIYGRPDMYLEYMVISPEMTLVYPEKPHGPRNRALANLGIECDVRGDAVCYKSVSEQVDHYIHYFSDDEEDDKENLQPDNGEHDVYYDCMPSDIDSLKETLEKDRQKRREFMIEMNKMVSRGAHIIRLGR